MQEAVPSAPNPSIENGVNHPRFWDMSECRRHSKSQWEPSAAGAGFFAPSSIVLGRIIGRTEPRFVDPIINGADDPTGIVPSAVDLLGAAARLIDLRRRAVPLPLASTRSL